jgi:hypothetical protein
MSLWRNVGATLTTALLIASCANTAEPIDETSTTSPNTTLVSPTTTAAPPTTNAPATTSTSPSSVVDEAEGSGCTPGPSQLADGEWFGYVVAATESDLDFDLSCWFIGDAATRAAAEDGEESPPPNDYYIRNTNETPRTLDVSADTEVVWYPEPGDPTSEATVAYSGWIEAIEDREFLPMVWLTVEAGKVVAVHEQWVP